MMKKILFLTVSLFLFSTKTFACDCECSGDCTFKSISEGMEFVALVKVVEFSDYLEEDILGYEEKMPASMTVEVIKRYKGKESRKMIKIWGDDGALCRPYTANFKIGEYYLIAPNLITAPNKNESNADYEFFSCFVDYMKVDFRNAIAYGDYTKRTNKIPLEKFEKNLKK